MTRFLTCLLVVVAVATGAPTVIAQAPSSFAGKWAVTIHRSTPVTGTLDLTVKDSVVTGTFSRESVTVDVTGKVETDRLVSFDTPDAYFRAALRDGRLEGAYVYRPDGRGIFKTGWSATRIP